MKGYFRTKLRKFCLEGSVLGLKYFYLYPDPMSRCFWTVNMVAVLSLAFLLSFLLYNRFLEMPTRITIENQYEPVQNLPYPTITICSPNQITISFMEHFNKTLVDGNLTLNVESVLPNLLGYYELIGDLNYDDLTHLQTLLDLNRYTVPDVMGAIPQSCNRFLKLCYFEQQRHANCGTLFQPILTQHGLCCAFNSLYYFKDGKINVRNRNFVSRMVKGSGLPEGLTIVTDYEPADAMDGTVVNAGAIRVMYSDWSEFPADDESNLVDVNVESHHVISATYTYCSEDVQALQAWSRKCYFEHEHQMPFFKKYHNSDCDLMCFAQAVEKTCHCLLFFIPHVHVARTCNFTSIACIIRAKLQMSKWMQTEKCDCPRDCVSRRYKVDLVMGNLNALPHMAVNLYDNLTFNKSTSIMHFYFHNSVYVKQKQETVMSLITLSSNLGGVFGLCLGCSFISVLEIMFYVYQAVRNYTRERLLRTWRHSVGYYK